MPVWNKYLIGSLLAGGALALYWPTFQYPIFFDDRNLLADGHVFNFFLGGFSFSTRWLPYMTMAWIELLFENALFMQRLFNLVLHMITAYVLYRLVLQVSDHVAPHHNNTRAAMAAAALFLLHPVAVYAVGYIIQRSILMATLFGLLSLSAYFEGLTKRSQAQFWFAGLFYLLLSFSKEHAVLVPVAALLLTPLAGTMDRKMLLRMGLPVLLYTGVAIGMIYRYRSVIGIAYEPSAPSMLAGNVCDGAHLCSWALSAMTQAWLYFGYLLRMVWPNPDWLSIDWRVSVARNFGQIEFWFGMLALAGYAALASFWLLKRGRLGLVGFSLLAPLALFAVEFSTVRVQEPFVLYRAYLWMPLLFLMLPAVSNTLPARLFWSLFFVVAFGLAWAAHDRLRSFSSEFSLWDDAARKLSDPQIPGAARIFVNRGGFFLRDGQYDAALADFSRALQADPASALAHRGVVFAYLGRKEPQIALNAVQMLIGMKPDEPEAYTARGYVYSAMNDMVRARADFERGCENHPWKNVCVQMAIVASRRGVSASELQ